MTLLWIAWLVATSPSLAIDDHRHHYASPTAPAAFKANKTDIKSLTDDVVALRAALEQASGELGACSATESARHQELKALVSLIRYRRKGGAKETTVQQSTGDPAVDHCMLTILQTLPLKLRFTTTFRLRITPPGPRDLDTDPTPLWHFVHEHHLDNGLRLLHVPRPGRRPVMRLVVGVGSLDEEDGEQGLAHFVEHMAFRGTEDAEDMVFSVDGGEAAAHGNAFTSFDATVYELQSKEDEPTEVQLELVRTWLAGEVAFEPAEVEVERKVVIEELRWRYADVDERFTRLHYGGTRWAERMPIGTQHSLQSFTPADAEAFYRRWYRPDNATLIIVGGTDVGAIKEQVEQSVGRLPRPSTPLSRTAWTPRRPDGARAIFVGGLGEPAMVQIQTDLHLEDVADHRQLRSGQFTSLLAMLIHARLVDAGHEQEREWQAWASTRWRARGQRVFQLTVRDRDKEASGMELMSSVHRELRRIHQHGFTQEELDAAVETSRERYARYRDRLSTDSPTEHAEEFVRHVRFNEPVPGRMYERQFAEAWLRDLDLQTLSEQFRAIFEPGATITVASLDRDPESLPPDSEALSLVLEAWQEDTLPPVGTSDEDEQREPVEPMLDERARISSRLAVEGATYGGFVTDTGVHVYVLPSGWLYGSKVRIQLIGPGVGTRRGTDRVDVAAAEALPHNKGIPGHSGQAFERWLRERHASVHLKLGARRSTLTVRGPTEDFADLMAVLRWTLHGPAAVDASALADAVGARLREQDGRHDERIVDDVSKELLGEHGPLPDDARDHVDPERASDLLRQVFGDPSALSLVLTGGTPERKEREQPILQALAAWPTAPEDGVPLTVAVLPDAPVVRELDVGSPGKAHVQVVLHTPLSAEDSEAALTLPVLAPLLRQHLMQTLRIDEGLFYTVDVDAGRLPGESPAGLLRLTFTCDAARADEARTLLDAALATFPDALDDEAVSAAVRRGRYRASTSRRWFQRFMNEVHPGFIPESKHAHAAQFEALELDIDAVRELAHKFVVEATAASVVAWPHESP